jgi:hypothetical protein
MEDAEDSSKGGQEPGAPATESAASKSPDEPRHPTSPGPQPGSPGPSPPTAPPAGPGGWRRSWVRDVVLVAGTVVLVLAVQALLDRGDDDQDDSGTAEGPPTEDQDDAAASPPEPDDGSADGTDQADPTSTTENRRRPGNFEDGAWAVGREIQPGRYIVTGLDQNQCRWARLSDAAGDNVIVEETHVQHQAVVDILETDGGFRSENCGVWEVYEPPIAPPRTSFDEGDWVVGDHIEPGVYEHPASATCSWTHASGFEHTAEEVIESVSFTGQNQGPFTVELSAGERFSVQGRLPVVCGTWVKLG